MRCRIEDLKGYLKPEKCKNVLTRAKNLSSLASIVDISENSQRFHEHAEMSSTYISVKRFTLLFLTVDEKPSYSNMNMCFETK